MRTSPLAAKFETFELDVADFAFGGMALGRLESGKVCFVRGAAPGERILARSVADKPSHRVASLVEVLRPSPRRVERFCPFSCGPDAGGLGESRQCPGCSYQHVPYEDELAAKDAQLRSFISRWLKLDPAGIALAPFAAPSRAGWRNKITLGCGSSPKGYRPGYKASDNRSLVPVDDCPLAHDALRSLMREELPKRELLDVIQDSSRLTFRHTSRDGALFWLNDPPRGSALLTESLPFGELRVPRGSFFQVNPEVAGALLSSFAELVRAHSPEAVLDMYCGVGVFGLAAAKAGVPHVEGCEMDPAAIAAAKENAKSLGLDNCNYVSGDAAKLFKSLSSGLQPAKSMLVLDPPRCGLSEKALKEAASLRAKHLVYVSCSADALCRDLKPLLASGYRLVSARAFDMFPSTAHFETLAFLELA